MSDSAASDFGNAVPGFDFLQNLMRASAEHAAASPFVSWTAPTMDEQELEKRIAELKTVRFWLEQNSHALTATIQALEVQKMTLAALKAMHFSGGGSDVPNASAAAGAAGNQAHSADAARATQAQPGVADPMRFWTAWTQQFQKIAQSAMQEANKRSHRSDAPSAPAAQEQPQTQVTRARASGKKASPK